MSRTARRTRFLGVALAATCASLVQAQDVHVSLDPRTGTTLQVTAEPWVLALDQPHLAAHARDYVALQAVQASNGGQHRYYLAAFYWSSVPGRNRHAGQDPALRMLLDDRDLQFTPGMSLRDAGISQWPRRAPGRDALVMLYVVDPQVLRQLGHAGRLRVRPEPASGLPPEIWFDTWRDARHALRIFAAQVLPPP